MFFKHTNLYKCRFTNTSITVWENLLKQENPFPLFSQCKDGNRNLQKICFDNLNKHCRVLILLSSHPVSTVFLMYVQQFCRSLYSLSFPNTYGVKWHISIKKKESSSTLFFLLCFFLKFLTNSYVLFGHQVAIWKKVKLGVRLFTNNSALKLFLKNTLIIDERASFFASFLASFLSSSSVKFSRNVGTKSCRIWKICL